MNTSCLSKFPLIDFFTQKNKSHFGVAWAVRVRRNKNTKKRSPPKGDERIFVFKNYLNNLMKLLTITATSALVASPLGLIAPL